MTTGPTDERPAPPGRLRASHVDRDQVISALKTAFIQGRLAKDEFDARVGQALTSRTHAELAVITADIPADPIVARPAQPVLGVKSGVYVTALAAMLAATLWAAAATAGSAAAGAAALTFSGVVIFTLFVTGYQIREARHPGRPAEPLPPGTAG